MKTHDWRYSPFCHVLQFSKQMNFASFGWVYFLSSFRALRALRPHAVQLDVLSVFSRTYSQSERVGDGAVVGCTIRFVMTYSTTKASTNLSHVGCTLRFVMTYSRRVNHQVQGEIGYTFHFPWLTALIADELSFVWLDALSVLSWLTAICLDEIADCRLDVLSVLSWLTARFE